MCVCKKNQWARTGEETHCGRFPMSEHAPGCDEFKQEPFAVIEYDGARCIVEKIDGPDMAETMEGDYKYYFVMLTRDQFDRLEEFQGF